jgi:hypothetical protein
LRFRASIASAQVVDPREAQLLPSSPPGSLPGPPGSAAPPPLDAVLGAAETSQLGRSGLHRTGFRRWDTGFLALDSTAEPSSSSARGRSEFTPHQFRHLAAKIVLDANAGAYELVRQLLGHKNLQDDHKLLRRHRHATCLRTASCAPLSSTTIGREGSKPVGHIVG